jgi:hypothetical protein
MNDKTREEISILIKATIGNEIKVKNMSIKITGNDKENNIVERIIDLSDFI